MSVLPLLLVALAFAGDEDDDLDLDDDLDIGPPAPAPAQPAPPQPAEPAPIDDGDEQDQGLESFRETGDDTDLLGDDTGPSSTDSEREYRDTQAKLGKLDPDEAIAGWEAYLAQHPTTPFRGEIEHRVEELTDQMYATGVGPQAGDVDAMDQEFDFAHPLQLENVNPRTRFEVAFEYGLTDYANLVLDYEHAFARSFSAHAGIRHRYMGWNLETGVRWAPVKSLRTKTIVTLIGDLRFNSSPAYPGFRPQLALSKRLGKLDATLMGGTDLAIRAYNEGPDDALVKTTVLETNWTGGAMLYFAASDQVGVFGEANLYLRTVPPDGAFDGGVYNFDVASFGLKFFPGKEKDKEINFGASVPVAQQYWQFHYGSIMGQLNWYL